MKFELRRDCSSHANSAAGVVIVQSRPRLSAGLDPDNLRLIAESGGTKYADNLIGDRRWPRCNQKVAIAAAEAIVRTAITDVAAILNAGVDFRPHIKMMSSATWCGFQNSLPSRGIN